MANIKATKRIKTVIGCGGQSRTNNNLQTANLAASNFQVPSFPTNQALNNSNCQYETSNNNDNNLLTISYNCNGGSNNELLTINSNCGNNSDEDENNSGCNCGCNNGNNPIGRIQNYDLNANLVPNAATNGRTGTFNGCYRRRCRLD